MAVITPINIGFLNAAVAQWYGLPANHPAASQPSKAAILCFHIATPSRSVLVDAASDVLPPGFEMIPGGGQPPLKDQLAALGITAQQISDVVITHPHWDHINGLTELAEGRHVPVFLKARHYLGAADWQPEKFGELEHQTLMVIEQWGLLELVQKGKELGEGLSILPMPGETPGHQGLYMKDGDIEAYFCGDLYHHPIEFDEDINVHWAEPQTMQASKRAIAERAAKSGAKVYFSHIEGAYQTQWNGQGFGWRVG